MRTVTIHEANVPLQDRPSHFPVTQLSGAPLKPITQVLLDRRATSHFKPDPIPHDYLEAILRFAAQAPSGYNLQPWRFLVIRQPENRRRLQKAAMGQPKVAEAPVMIVAFAVPGQWRSQIHSILQQGAERGLGSSKDADQQEKAATGFLEGMDPAVWLNRQTMIAVTTMMLVAEAYGLDTAPMEGFDPEAIKREFSLPAEAEIIALLALGFAQKPDKAYGGRLPLTELVHEESYGHPWDDGRLR